MGSTLAIFTSTLCVRNEPFQKLPDKGLFSRLAFARRREKIEWELSMTGGGGGGGLLGEPGQAAQTPQTKRAFFFPPRDKSRAPGAAR